MSLASPLALLALLPWGALAWWLLRERAEQAAVPFLGLWPTAPGVNRTIVRRRPPPAFVVLALLALLLAILAASGPSVISRAGEAPLILVIDRGSTMSAVNPDRRSRLAQFATDHANLLEPLADATVRVRFVPDPGANRELPAGSWGSIALSVSPRAAETATLLGEVVAEALADPQRRVLLISDRPFPAADGRLFQVGPGVPVVNAAVIDVSVAGDAALVTLSSNFESTEATLRVDEGAPSRIMLPEAGGRSQHPVTVPPGADAFTVSLEAPSDAWPGDNRFALARTRAWPRLEPDETLPRPLRRMAGVFTEARPPRPHSRRIAMGTTVAADIILARGGTPVRGEWAVMDHPVAAGVSWSTLQAAAAADFPFAGDRAWRPVVRCGDAVLLAITEDGSERRAWVGFDAQEWTETPEFVRFWADVITWVNGGPEAWTSRTLEAGSLAEVELDDALPMAGIQVGPAGPVAWNLPRPDFAVASWQEDKLTTWLGDIRPAWRAGAWLLASAAAMAGAACLLWPRRFGQPVDRVDR